jgi:hypothetical protein
MTDAKLIKELLHSEPKSAAETGEFIIFDFVVYKDDFPDMTAEQIEKSLVICSKVN